MAEAKDKVVAHLIVMSSTLGCGRGIQTTLAIHRCIKILKDTIEQRKCLLLLWSWLYPLCYHPGQLSQYILQKGTLRLVRLPLQEGRECLDSLTGQVTIRKAGKPIRTSSSFRFIAPHIRQHSLLLCPLQLYLCDDQ